MIEIDDKDIKKLERDFKAYAKRAYPFATKATINTAAFKTQKESRTLVDEQMINRNRYTKQSIRVEQARTLDVRRQVATVGSIAPYMETQEFGGTKRRTGKHGVAIPTSYSAGEGMNAKPRMKLPRKPNKLQNIQLRKRMKKGPSRKQQNVVAVREAAAAGHKLVYLDLGRKQGIFRITGGVRRPRLRMLYDLSETSVTIKATPWLRPSVDKVQKTIPEIYREAMIAQARRNRLFGYK